MEGIGQGVRLFRCLFSLLHACVSPLVVARLTHTPFVSPLCLPVLYDVFVLFLFFIPYSIFLIPPRARRPSFELFPIPSPPGPPPRSPSQWAWAWLLMQVLTHLYNDSTNLSLLTMIVENRRGLSACEM